MAKNVLQEAHCEKCPMIWSLKTTPLFLSQIPVNFNPMSPGGGGLCLIEKEVAISRELSD